MDDLISRKAVRLALSEVDMPKSVIETEFYDVMSNVADRLIAVPSVDAIPIEPLAVWLAGYRVSPPEYALIQAGAYDEIDPASVVYTASQSAKAWAYHLRKLMESGLMDE